MVYYAILWYIMVTYSILPHGIRGANIICIGIMEKEMETAILYIQYVGRRGIELIGSWQVYD